MTKTKTKTKTKTSRSALALAIGVLIGAGSYGAFVAAEQSLARVPGPERSGSAAVAPAVGSTLSTMSEELADLAERVTPAVVRIEVKMTGTPEDAMAPRMPVPEGFRRFFDLPDMNAPDMEPAPRIGGGTGFVVSDDGYIVTNDHVVGHADEITVTLNDHRTFPAELIGTDPTTDVAVIRIDAGGLPTLPWGSSKALRVGEWVMAVGNPGFAGAGQLDYTVTTGIVSAKGRPLRLLGQSLEQDPRYGRDLAGYAIENFIQTDAVINPGNSGGPMVNLRGEVVGVNSAIASADGYYQGYGFAIPADLARKTATDLMEHGRVLRAWLGVQVTGVAPEDAEFYRLPAVEGVLVQAVTGGSPAADAGLRQGDVIVAVDGAPVSGGGGLQELIAERHQGDGVRLKVYRDGSVREFRVRLGEAPFHTGSAENEIARTPTASERFGMELSDLNPELARRFGFSQTDGVVIVGIEPWSSAARRGVTPGLRVREVSGHAVASAREVAEILSKIESGTVVSFLLETPQGQTRIANVRAR